MSLLVRISLGVRRGPLVSRSRVWKRRLGTHDRTRLTQSGSLLSQVEAEIAAKRAQGGTAENTSVGPFQLGISQESMSGPKLKPWKELSTGGKGEFISSRYH